MDLCLPIKGFESNPIKFKDEKEFDKLMSKLSNADYAMLENMLRGRDFTPEILQNTLLAKKKEMDEGETQKAIAASKPPEPPKKQSLPPQRPESRKDPAKVKASESAQGKEYKVKSFPKVTTSISRSKETFKLKDNREMKGYKVTIKEFKDAKDFDLHVYQSEGKDGKLEWNIVMNDQIFHTRSKKRGDAVELWVQNVQNPEFIKKNSKVFENTPFMEEVKSKKEPEENKWFNESNGEWEDPLFSTEYYFKSKPATTAVLNTIVERLTAMNPDITVELVSDATMNLMGFHEKRGAVYKGKVYINVDRASTGDLVHEYAEIWLEAVQKEDPNFFTVMAELALSHPNVEHIREAIRQKEGLDNDRLAKEVIATLIGEHFNGNRIISKSEKSWWGKAKGYFMNLLDKMAEMVGNALNLRGERKKIFNETDSEVILNNPLEKIIDRFADEILHKPIKDIKASDMEGYLINSGVANINSSVNEMNAYKKTLTDLTCKI